MDDNNDFFTKNRFSVGKRTQESCGIMMEKLSERMEQPSPQTKIEVFTDGNDDYTYARLLCGYLYRLWAACEDQGERKSRPQGEKDNIR